MPLECNDPNLQPGLDGINAFTVTNAAFTMPAVNANATVPVLNSGQQSGAWAAVGQYVFIENAGYFQVISATPIQLVLKNLGLTGNVTPGTSIGAQNKVSPAGIPGIAGNSGTNGSNGADGLDGTTILFNQTTPQVLNSPGQFNTMAFDLNIANHLPNIGDEILSYALFGLEGEVDGLPAGKYSFPAAIDLSVNISGSISTINTDVIQVACGTSDGSSRGDGQPISIAEWKIKITRTATNTLYINFESQNFKNRSFLWPPAPIVAKWTQSNSIAGLSGAIITMTPKALSSSGAQGLRLIQHTIYKFKKA